MARIWSTTGRRSGSRTTRSMFACVRGLAKHPPRGLGTGREPHGSFPSGNVCLVAHSLGCLAVVWWAASRTDCARRVDGAVLVAPPDLSSAPGALPALSSFTPLPLARLPFPSLLVASENDPFVSIEAAARFARQWGSEFVNEGRGPHQCRSGHGAWPEGERRFQRFLDAVSATSSAASAHARF